MWIWKGYVLAKTLTERWVTMTPPLKDYFKKMFHPLQPQHQRQREVRHCRRNDPPTPAITSSLRPDGHRRGHVTPRNFPDELQKTTAAIYWLDNSDHYYQP